MTDHDDPKLKEFERRARAVLDEGVHRVDGSVRSRLTQARHAALAEAESARRPFWKNFTLMPLAGATAAAVLVAMVLWTNSPQQSVTGGDGAQSSFDDIELLADGEALDLIEEWDGSFYEWAAAQAESGSEASTS